MIHDLKCWPEPFELIRLGVKRHEARVDGPKVGMVRFHGGDVLLLREWIPGESRYTGRRHLVLVERCLHLWETPKDWQIHADVSVMEIRPLELAERLP